MYTRITFNNTPGVERMNTEQKEELGKYKLQTDANIYTNFDNLRIKTKDHAELSKKLTEFQERYESACRIQNNDDFVENTTNIQLYLDTLDRKSLPTHIKRSINDYTKRNNKLFQYEKKLNESLINAGEYDNTQKEIKKQKIKGGSKRRKKTKRRKTKNKYFN